MHGLTAHSRDSGDSASRTNGTGKGRQHGGSDGGGEGGMGVDEKATFSLGGHGETTDKEKKIRVFNPRAGVNRTGKGVSEGAESRRGVRE